MFVTPCLGGTLIVFKLDLKYVTTEGLDLNQVKGKCANQPYVREQTLAMISCEWASSVLFYLGPLIFHCRAWCHLSLLLQYDRTRMSMLTRVDNESFVHVFLCVWVRLYVSGESGLGKSTLVNSLFLTDLYKDRKLLNAEGKRFLDCISCVLLALSVIEFIKRLHLLSDPAIFGHRYSCLLQHIAISTLIWVYFH